MAAQTSEQIYVFKGLLWDVFSDPMDLPLKSRFQELNTYPEFSEENLSSIRINIDAVIRYIVAVYDKRGLRVYEENLNKRKRIGAELVGWKTGANGKFAKVYEDVIMNRFQPINNMIIRYLKLQRSVEYAALVAFEEQYYSMISKMISDESDNVSKGEYETFVKVEAELTRRIGEFANADTSRELQSDIIEYIEMEKLELRPEDVAKRLKEGKKVVPNFDPYAGWEPGILKFIKENEKKDE